MIEIHVYIYLCLLFVSVYLGSQRPSLVPLLALLYTCYPKQVSVVWKLLFLSCYTLLPVYIA